MTDEQLDQVAAVCVVEAGKGRKVELSPDDVLQLISELRELRSHATALGALEGAAATMHRLLVNLVAYGERPPAEMNLGTRIPVQDPGR